jgi:hypothetical protein
MALLKIAKLAYEETTELFNIISTLDDHFYRRSLIFPFIADMATTLGEAR